MHIAFFFHDLLLFAMMENQYGDVQDLREVPQQIVPICASARSDVENIIIDQPPNKEVQILDKPEKQKVTQSLINGFDEGCNILLFIIPHYHISTSYTFYTH